MRQQRLSIDCRDWRTIIEQIGPEAAGAYLYLRTLMRSMQAAEITITVQELAKTIKVPSEAAESALRAILAAGLLEQLRDTRESGTITLRSPEEAKALADLKRKRTARAAAKMRQKVTDLMSGQSGGQSVETGKTTSKSYETDFFMVYSGQSEQQKKQKENTPRTPQKEKTLTEPPGPAHTRESVVQPELPADDLEARYIDVCGSWPQSLRKAIQAEKEDIREAFYLYIRTRESRDGKKWSADLVRIAWLAARRVPEERRADSILAAAMGHWKTIRDCGSGVYFEKDTGRVVSLVRGPVETRRKTAAEQLNEELAARFARNMRRG